MTWTKLLYLGAFHTQPIDQEDDCNGEQEWLGVEEPFDPRVPIFNQFVHLVRWTLVINLDLYRVGKHAKKSKYRKDKADDGPVCNRALQVANPSIINRVYWQWQRLTSICDLGCHSYVQLDPEAELNKYQGLRHPQCNT